MESKPKRTTEELHTSLMESVGSIGTKVEAQDEDGTMLESAKKVAKLCGVPLESEALRVFILGVGMGVVMDGETRNDRQEMAKPLLKDMMYLHKLAMEGKL